MKSIAKRAWIAFAHPEAWILIILGMTMFSIHTPLADTALVNFPYAATVFQTAGLMFSVFGFQIMASLFMWPTLSFPALLRAIGEDKNVAAGLAVMGLLVFNGLCMIAFTVWLSGTLSMGAGAR